MEKLKGIWERFKKWFNRTGNAMYIGGETSNEQAIEKFVDEEVERAIHLQQNVNPIEDIKEKQRLEAKLKSEMTQVVNDHANIKEDDVRSEVLDDSMVVKNGEETTTIKPQNAEIKKIEPRNIGYMDRLAILHDMKMKLYKEQEAQGKGVTDLRYTEIMMRYEKEILEHREEYIAGLTDKEKEKFKQEEAKLQREELEAKKRAEEEYITRCSQFSVLVGEVERFREQLAAIQQQFEDNEIDIDTYESQKQEIQSKLQVTLVSMNMLNPNELLEDSRGILEREAMQLNILGGDYRTRLIENSTLEMASRISQSHSKDMETVHTIKSNEEYFQQNGIHAMAIELKEHLDNLNKELESVQEEMADGNISSDKLQRAKDLLIQVEKTTEEAKQYEGMDDTLTNREDPNTLGVIDHAEDAIQATNEQVEEKYEDLEETIDAVEEHEGRDIVAEPNKIDDVNEGEYVPNVDDDPMGLGLINNVMDKEAVAKHQAREDALKKQAKEDIEDMKKGIKIR